MSESPLERSRRLALSLPETAEKLAWGAPTFRVGKAERMFATFADGHHGDGYIALWCAAPTGKQQVLVETEPARVFRPAYLGPKGWIGLVLEHFDDDELAAHLREAYVTVAPKRLARLVEPG